MSYVQTLSTNLSNAVTPPLTASTNKAVAEIMNDTVAVPIGSAADQSVLKLAVPVTANISSIKVGWDALGADATMSVGFFNQVQAPIGATFTAVAAAAVLSAASVASATPPVDKRYTVLASDTMGAPAWSLAGLESAPNYAELFIGLTFPAAVTTAGNVYVEVTMTPESEA